MDSPGKLRAFLRGNFDCRYGSSHERNIYHAIINSYQLRDGTLVSEFQ
jgi:hypothetical protein